MRKILHTALALCFLVPSAFAADGLVKTSMEIGGSASFTTSEGSMYGSDRVSTITLEPTVGYFVRDNLAIGLDLAYSASKGGDGTGTSYSLGPFVHYYLDEYGPGYPFFQLHAGYGHEMLYEGPFRTVNEKNAVTSIGGGIGYVYFINDYMGLFGLASYSRSFGNQIEPVNGATRNGSVLNFFIGLRVYQF